MKNQKISIIGAGLSGCEAALQLSDNGYDVTLYDEKPDRLLSAYSYSTFAELVCNNAISPIDTTKPLGLLVAELKIMGSKLIKIADTCRLRDQDYFAVDKELFSKTVTNALVSSGINIISESVSCLPQSDIVIIASGPLTNDSIVNEISKKFNIEGFHFYDASSPIVDITSLDVNNSNYLKISDDLYAVRISDENYRVFSDKLIKCNTSNKHKENRSFDKCLSLEELAALNKDKLKETRFKHPCLDGICLLLRREKGLANGFIMVGCMTTLNHPDQKEVFSCLPGFRDFKMVKYGRMHRNTFFQSPKVLDSFFKIRNEDIYIIGQLSGIDGYAPAIASGLIAAYRIIYGEKMMPFPKNTIMGGLANYVSNPEVVDFQPMCASFSLLENQDDTDFLLSSQISLNDYIKHLA